jgi:hypothetical protein
MADLPLIVFDVNETLLARISHRDECIGVLKEG